MNAEPVDIVESLSRHDLVERCRAAEHELDRLREVIGIVSRSLQAFAK